MTRTRTASFAMQSQRVTDMSDADWNIAGGSLRIHDAFNAAMSEAVNSYSQLVDDGMSLEDARDVLPIGIHCNLIVKYNLRSFVELVRVRESLRVQGPYVDVVTQMKKCVLSVWPWAETFFEPKESKAIKMIEEVAQELAGQGAMYKGPSGKLAKAADLLKK